MDRIPTQSELTSGEIVSLKEIAKGFRSRAFRGAGVAHLVQLGLIQEIMGGLMVTPAGKMVAGK
ncbi:MAG TPA: hypothetical protein VNH44_01985 [Micropepsaceae bacterium]|nr:hypothetical protein [Micropepsaceae bacterium]